MWLFWSYTWDINNLPSSNTNFDLTTLRCDAATTQQRITSRATLHVKMSHEFKISTYPINCNLLLQHSLGFWDSVNLLFTLTEMAYFQHTYLHFYRYQAAFFHYYLHLLHQTPTTLTSGIQQILPFKLFNAIIL